MEKLNQVQVCCGGNHEEVFGESRPGPTPALLWWQPGESSWGEQRRSRSAVVATMRRFSVWRADHFQLFSGGNHQKVLGGESKSSPAFLWCQPRGDARWRWTPTEDLRWPLTPLSSSHQVGPMAGDPVPRPLQAPPLGARRGDHLPGHLGLLSSPLPRRREHQELHLGPHQPHRERQGQGAPKPLG